MDWLQLTTEVLAKKNEEILEKDYFLSKTVEDGSESLEDADKKLTPLEAITLSVVLEIASLQFFIIEKGMGCSSSQFSSNVARDNIAEMLNETEKELQEHQTFMFLYKKAKEESEKKRNEKELMESMLQNHAKIENLRSKLNGHELKKETEMNKKQETIALLKDKTHEELIKNDVKLRYVELWETARQGQNRIRCQNAESELDRKLEEVNNKTNKEIRVHQEMCTFLELEVQTLLETLESWKQKYEKEMIRRTERIKMLQKRKKEQQILLQELRNSYKEHEEEISDYLDFKERLQKEQELERHMNKMATKIQAWWRGTMVRRGLGSFKKKKKLPKEKKKIK